LDSFPKHGLASILLGQFPSPRRDMPNRITRLIAERLFFDHYEIGFAVSPHSKLNQAGIAGNGHKYNTSLGFCQPLSVEKLKKTEHQSKIPRPGSRPGQRLTQLKQ
jgi:hypothetical protein